MMEYQIERLKVEDYDELLDMLNRSFNKQEGDTFDVILPVMWERDEEHMAKHIAIRIDGKIAAVVGIYPLPAVICGRKIMFGTIGNVATLPEYNGQGLMRRLVTEALKEAKQMGMDVARLGGLRQRYNRYGFDHGGADYQYILTKRNLREYYGADKRFEVGKMPENDKINAKEMLQGIGITFKQVTLEDTELLQFAIKLHRQSDFYIDRGEEKQFFKTMSAWCRKLWIAYGLSGEPVGYISASADGTDIAEHKAFSAKEEYLMLCEWLKFVGAEKLTVHTAPWEVELNQYLGRICESWNQQEPSMFHPFNWSKLLDALLAIKSKYTLIPNGRFLLGIEGYGTVELQANRCIDTNQEPHITISHLEAIRFLLGSLPTEAVISSWKNCPISDENKLYVQSILPLPLWWCDQDRV